MDKNRCKYQYGSAQQHQHQFVNIYIQIEQREGSVQYGKTQQINTNDKDKDLMKGTNILDKTKCFEQRIKLENFIDGTRHDVQN